MAAGADQHSFCKVKWPLLNLCMSAVSRTRPTLTRMWSWSVTSAAPYLQVSWLHRRAARKARTRCRKSGPGFQLHPRNSAPSDGAQPTFKPTRRPQILIKSFYIFSYKRKERLMSLRWQAAPLPVHTCAMDFQWGIIDGNLFLSLFKATLIPRIRTLFMICRGRGIRLN